MNAQKHAPRNRGLVKKLTAAVSANFQTAEEVAKHAGLAELTPLQMQNALNYAARLGRIERTQINGRAFHYRMLKAPRAAQAPTQPSHRRSKNSLAAVVDMNGDIVLGKMGTTLHITQDEAKRLVAFLHKLSKL